MHTTKQHLSRRIHKRPKEKKDDAHKQKCRYCDKPFTYIGMLKKHIVEICSVRKEYFEYGNEDHIDKKWEDMIMSMGNKDSKDAPTTATVSSSASTKEPNIPDNMSDISQDSKGDGKRRARRKRKNRNWGNKNKRKTSSNSKEDENISDEDKSLISNSVDLGELEEEGDNYSIDTEMSIKEEDRENESDVISDDKRVKENESKEVKHELVENAGTVSKDKEVSQADKTDTIMDVINSVVGGQEIDKDTKPDVSDNKMTEQVGKKADINNKSVTSPGKGKEQRPPLSLAEVINAESSPPPPQPANAAAMWDLSTTIAKLKERTNTEQQPEEANEPPLESTTENLESPSKQIRGNKMVELDASDLESSVAQTGKDIGVVNKSKQKKSEDKTDKLEHTDAKKGTQANKGPEKSNKVKQKNKTKVTEDKSPKRGNKSTNESKSIVSDSEATKKPKKGAKKKLNEVNDKLTDISPPQKGAKKGKNKLEIVQVGTEQIKSPGLENGDAPSRLDIVQVGTEPISDDSSPEQGSKAGSKKKGKKNSPETKTKSKAIQNKNAKQLSSTGSKKKDDPKSDTSAKGENSAAAVIPKKRVTKNASSNEPSNNSSKDVTQDVKTKTPSPAKLKRGPIKRKAPIDNSHEEASNDVPVAKKGKKAVPKKEGPPSKGPGLKSKTESGPPATRRALVKREPIIGTKSKKQSELLSPRMVSRSTSRSTSRSRSASIQREASPPKKVKQTVQGKKANAAKAKTAISKPTRAAITKKSVQAPKGRGASVQKQSPVKKLTATQKKKAVTETKSSLRGKKKASK